jgi:hypothetical protein
MAASAARGDVIPRAKEMNNLLSLRSLRLPAACLPVGRVGRVNGFQFKLRRFLLLSFYFCLLSFTCY